MRKLRFALDQNFPEPIVDALRNWIVEADLVPVRTIDSRLARVDDWRLLLSLHNHAEIDGLVTTDSDMLNLPREVAVLNETTLTLVVAKAAGHDPVLATGLLLAHLPQVCRKFVDGQAQVFELSAGPRTPTKPWEKLKRIANHQNVDVGDLWREHRLGADEKAADPLSGIEAGE